MQLDLLVNVAIAIALGLIVGAERERASSAVAGVRTFTLITVLGVLAASLGPLPGSWLVPAAFAGVVALLITGNLMLARQNVFDAGMTTEVAALLMFMVGAALASGFRIAATVVAASVALLLHWKQPMQALLARLGETEYRAIMRMVLIGLVILPVLPDRDFGPYAVINPFRIWLMVVLIVGISLASYLAWRLFGSRMGVALSGIIGGLISSTAATVGYARRTRRSPAGNDAAALMILIASTVVFARVLIEIAVVAPAALPALAPPLAAMLVLMIAICAFAWRRARSRLESPAEPGSPSDLRAAITFGLLYGAVLLGIAVAREHFGTSALYGVAALSGLTDMDAITLSTAQLVDAGRLEPQTAWRLILVGALANLGFKAAAVATLGDRGLLRRIGGAFAVAAAGGVLLLIAWR